MLGSSLARADDFVVVAVPVFAHAPVTLEALASGRHVSCEKPLAMNEDEAKLMFSAARAIPISRCWT